MDRPTRPAPTVSLLITANKAAKKIMRFPTVSRRTDNHLNPTGLLNFVFESGIRRSRYTDKNYYT